MKIFCWMQALDKYQADITSLYNNEKEVSLPQSDIDFYIKSVYETKLNGKSEVDQPNLKMYSSGQNRLLNIKLGLKDNLGRNNPIVILIEAENNDSLNVEMIERVLYSFVYSTLGFTGENIDSITNILNPVKKKSRFKIWITKRIRAIWEKIKRELQKL
ncbi:hypothetical protein [Acinetobacter haemolyticus]|uniref:hypothetical protein n=1 Tax=Acinetobacter haemolyticus TaxID=29430 RepID=UPI0002CFA33B|nr:hypothetical protein [Acinetobacter haemolyticus]ENW19122.1 hypothetical protein F926_02682 [Acinetobacter haemolyticus NIPH 261]NAR67703.1 hypothetical protein [Acinetobacter haemolyticus]NAR84323.1 hypothetical protein [Acinetobacter haemolyticus]